MVSEIASAQVRAEIITLVSNVCREKLYVLTPPVFHYPLQRAKVTCARIHTASSSRLSSFHMSSTSENHKVDCAASFPAGAGSSEGVVIVVMGVSGSGKTTLGAALAKALSLPFIDADDLHSEAHKAKMTRVRCMRGSDRHRPFGERTSGGGREGRRRSTRNG